MFKNLKIKDYDFKLIFLVLCTNILGILIIGSAAPELQQKQLLGSIMGVFLMVVVSLFDYKIILRFYWLWYFIMVAMLAAVKIAGSASHGSQRWFNIAGIRFQPSETAKIMLIIFLAQFIMKYKDRVNTVRFVVSYILLCGLPLGLTLWQPDLSTSIVITVVFVFLLFIAGISWKFIVGAIAVIIPTAIVLFSMILKEGQSIIQDYQRKRIMALIYPDKYADDAYQQLNSEIAIGSGRLLGKGLNNNQIDSLKNGNYIIEPQNDFVFAVIGEELGFLGSLFVILLLFAIALECFLIARKIKEIDGRIIAVGIGSLIGIQSFFNIGVATNLLPNTGLPLPFVSYGLTSLVSLYIGVGFVLNVRLRNKPVRDKKELSFMGSSI